VGFLNSTTISKIENKFREHGVVKNPKTEPPATLNEDAQLDVLLEIENNPH
jgi:hypothetical protein